jgi:hypothetical protein
VLSACAARVHLQVLAAFLKAIGCIIPLMDAMYASYYTREVMLVLVREFQTPDEEMKKIVLKVGGPARISHPAACIRSPACWCLKAPSLPATTSPCGQRLEALCPVVSHMGRPFSADGRCGGCCTISL